MFVAYPRKISDLEHTSVVSFIYHVQHYRLTGITGNHFTSKNINKGFILAIATDVPTWLVSSG